MSEKDAVEVVKRSRKLVRDGNVVVDNAKVEAETLIAKSKALVAEHARSQAAQGLLEILPQGHGSGLDADMVDGLHAAEIISKAAIRGSGGGGGGSSNGNATKIQDKDVDITARADDTILVFKTASDSYIHETKGTPGAHASTHENGGGDEISVAGLSGELADPQPPKAHNQALSTITEHDKAAHDALGIDAATLEGSNKATVQDHAPKAHTHPVAELTDHNKVAHDALDIDADTLDGEHASAFAAAGHNHNLADLAEKLHASLTNVGENDHHTKFTTTEHDTTVRHSLGTVVPHDALASLTEKSHTSLTDKGTNTHAQIDTHLAAAAPHSGHEATANKDQANGYAGLSAGSKLAASQMPTGKVKTTLSFAVTGTLTTGTDKVPTLVAPCALTITKVKLVVKTAPTGAAIIVDVNKNGTTIFTTQGNRPQIADGQTTGDSGAPDLTALAEGDKLTIDIDQIGSTIAGADLTVEVVADQAVAFS